MKFYNKYLYIIITIFCMFIGVNFTYAEDSSKTCYYVSDDTSASLYMYTDRGEVSIIEAAGVIINKSTKVLNWTSKKTDTTAQIKISPIYKNKSDLSECPSYLLFKVVNNYSGGGIQLFVYATNDLSVAQKFVNAINSVENTNKILLKASYASYKDSSGTVYTVDDVYGGEFVTDDEFNVDNYSDSSADCNELFGNKDTEGTIAYYVNKFLSYARIIVPIIVIVLGSLDLFKAMAAGKEDEMVKQRKRFVKRIIISIIIFFVPLIVNLLMYLADMVWAGQDFVNCQY